jgi:hypothetical protein
LNPSHKNHDDWVVYGSEDPRVQKNWFVVKFGRTRVEFPEGVGSQEIMFSRGTINED